MTRYLTTALLLVSTATAAHAEPTQLPTIVTTASRLDQPGYAVGSAITVITREQIEQQQAQFVTDVLRKVPGVAVSHSGGAGGLTQVRLRGAEANMTVVLVDGVKINDPGNDDSVDFNNLLAVDVERIEVLRGAQSVLWGSGAMGGVINIITREGKGKPEATLTFEGGSFGTTKADASLSGGGDKYGFVLGGSRFHTDGISAARGGTEKDPSTNSTIYGRVRVDPVENLSLSFAGRTSDQTLAYDQPPLDTSDTSATRRSWGQAQARLTLLDGHLENIALASLLHNESDAFGPFGGSTFDGRMRTLSDQINLFASSDFGLPLDHRVTLLVENERIEGNIGFVSGGTVVTTTSTGYAGEYALSYDERIFLTGGVRHDESNRFDDTTTYRFTGALRFRAAGTRLHGSYGTGVRNPSLSESFGFPGFTTPNLSLTPEKSKSADLGIEQSLWDSRLVFDATLFRNLVTDLIATGFPSATNIPGTTQINGAEFTALAHLGPALTLEGSYTMMQTQDATGTELTRRPRNVASFNVNYALEVLRANFNLGIDYNGRTRDTAFPPPFFSPVTYDLQPYTLVTFAASFALTENVELRARVENALDQDYEEIKYYNQPGIAAFGGLRIKFGG